MWNDNHSKAFTNFGRYFVPERETQIQIITDLIPPRNDAFHVLELACGEGLLAKAILERFPTSIVHGFDGSAEMLRRAQEELAPYGDRFDAQFFDLADRTWRRAALSPHAVVSSLAIHHLDGRQKRLLYRDVYHMLPNGGVFLVADLVQPASPFGNEVAAAAWDEAVRQRSLELDGHEAAFDHFRRAEWNYYRYPDPFDKPSGLYEQLKWLELAGFLGIDVFWMRAGHAIFGGRKLEGGEEA